MVNDINIFTIARKSTERYRKYYFCLIEGCGSHTLRRMSNHLITVHHITNATKRRQLLEESKKKGAQPPKGKKIEIDVRNYLQKSTHLVMPRFKEKAGSTRHFQIYSMKDLHIMAFR